MVGQRKKKSYLSNGELDLISMLWKEGPLTLAEAHLTFGRYGQPIAYPTMQTRLNRLVEKGIAARSSGRPARYRAVVSEEQVARGYLDRLLRSLVGTSVAPLVCHLLAERPLTEQEIAEIRKLLDQARPDQKH